MLTRTGLAISGFGVLVAVFFLFNAYPLVYFKSLSFELEDHRIVYKYKWDLLGFMDAPTDRKLWIRDLRNGGEADYELLRDVTGQNETHFYRSLDRNYLVLEGNDFAALIDYETLDLVEMGYGFEYLDRQVPAEARHCYGKIYRDAYREGECWDGEGLPDWVR
ncbi:MAG: hypothetical protein AAFR05_17680 [Bacteroidota bacterium]